MVRIVDTLLRKCRCPRLSSSSAAPGRRGRCLSTAAYVMWLIHCPGAPSPPSRQGGRGFVADEAWALGTRVSRVGCSCLKLTFPGIWQLHPEVVKAKTSGGFVVNRTRFEAWFSFGVSRGLHLQAYFATTLVWAHRPPSKASGNP